jgi:5-methylcytosine-specific restriction endonuclease McrA
MIDKIPDIRCRHLRGRTKFEGLWELQKGKCFYCKERMEKPIYKVKPTAKTATLDHVKPRSKGGKRPRNLVLACRLCNSRKGDMPAYKFVERLKGG